MILSFIDIEQGRSREEKERLKETHEAELEKLKEKNCKLQDSMREEYLGVIDSLRQLRRVENDCKVDMNQTSHKLSQVSESLESQTKEIKNVGQSLNEELALNIRKKEEDLERKERELMRLQGAVIQRQEVSDSERRKLTESILNLEAKLHQKELELESEKRQSEYEKEQLEFKRKQFESEREGFLENLKRERDKMYLDRDRYNRDLDKRRNELESQMKTLRKEKTKYNIHKRLRTSSANYDYEEGNGQNMEEFIKVIEEEKLKLKKEKEKLKTESKKIAETKKKLQIQKKDMAVAIDKLYDVEKGIEEKFHELDKLYKSATNVKVETVHLVEDGDKIVEGAGEVLADIKEAVAELLRQEQSVSRSCLAMEGERRQLEVTRQSVLCAGCSRPLSLTKSSSARDVRQQGPDWGDIISIRYLSTGVHGYMGTLAPGYKGAWV